MTTAAAVLTANFKHWGVRHVFGIPGKAISPILFALLEEEMEFVLSKHEAAAGYEAAGYSLMNGSIGVAVGTSGPGGTNLLSAAGQAKAFCVPLLLITGHPSAKDTGKPMGQDSSLFGTDLTALFGHVTKFSARIDRADLLRPMLQHALEKAVEGVQGPVHLSIPFDVLLEEIEPFILEFPAPHPLISPDLEMAAGLIDSAERPVLFLGKGVHASRAYKEVRHLAEYYGIPVITTPGGKGTFPSNHELALGAFGLGGTPEAAAYLQEPADLMIVIGTQLSDMSVAGLTEPMYPERILHFDYNREFIDKSLPVPAIPILGDIRANLSRMMADKPAADSGSFLFPPRRPALPVTVPGERMSAVSAVSAMRLALPDEAIVFGDDGSHSFYGIQNFDIAKAGTFFFDDIFGAMGNGLGYAIGAKLAAPGKTIVCLVGDGCLFMHGTELSTAQNYDAAVLFVVLNNGCLDMVEKGMRKMIGTSIGGTYETPLDAAAFARSMGVCAETCRTPDETAEAIEEALLTIRRTKKPAVVEVLVDQNEIPPTMGRQ
ncbi:thiamine pyrophosphate-binding protein [Sporosarcina trichiuri]|uniref:thiamine pyrophosphate-binding protein n=1 Tax=Sporosarcina trichiuri TaxID=3056445 RepID=UPI0025B5E29A|nr:thiamine pyrophosphate-binding protein [Sporosarcina sp. 0.2-SM1T-5]WJY26324.1 thiamine pyrophosphate-binding protein [Sporosarcina sp. 0.2-SM1T-5]